MKLTKYRVTDFRSVKDSDWIDVDHVTALIGVNESGKTNLLLPLWKFRPAREGELEPTADYPKKMFGDIRNEPENYKFIEAEFDTSSEAVEFSRISSYPVDQLERLIISRRFNGSYRWHFPDAKIVRDLPSSEVANILDRAEKEIDGIEALKGETEFKAEALAAIQEQGKQLDKSSKLDKSAIGQVASALKSIMPQEPMKTSVVNPRMSQLLDSLNDVIGVYPLAIRNKIGYTMRHEHEASHHRTVFPPVS